MSLLCDDGQEEPLELVEWLLEALADRMLNIGAGRVVVQRCYAAFWCELGLKNVLLDCLGSLSPQGRECVLWMLLRLCADDKAVRTDPIVTQYLTACDDLNLDSPVLRSLQKLLSAIPSDPSVGQDVRSLTEMRARCPGWRHANDHVNYRDISIVMSADEVNSKEGSYLPDATTVVPGAPLAEVVYLDRLFRLYREDLVGSTRSELAEDLRSHNPRRFYPSPKLTSIKAACVTLEVPMPTFLHDRIVRILRDSNPSPSDKDVTKPVPSDKNAHTSDKDVTKSTPTEGYAPNGTKEQSKDKKLKQLFDEGSGRRILADDSIVLLLKGNLVAATGTVVRLPVGQMVNIQERCSSTLRFGVHFFSPSLAEVSFSH